MKYSDYVKINSVNPLYLIIGEADGCIIEGNSIQESTENKYLIFGSTDKNKKVLENYTELWDKIKNSIKKIHGGKSSEYGKDYMKIKFYSDDNLSLNKLLKLHNLIIVVRFVLKKMVNIILKFS